MLFRSHSLTRVAEDCAVPLASGLRVVADDARVQRLTLFGKTRHGKRFAHQVVDRDNPAQWGFAALMQ